MQSVRTSLLAVVASLLVAPSLAQAKSPQLGVVDVQKVMEATPAWNNAVKKLKVDWEKTRAELEAKQAGLQKEKEKLDAKRVVSDPKAVAQEEQKLLAQANQFRMILVKSQQGFAQREGQLKEAMLGRIERVVYAMAEKGDYTYIFEMGSMESPNVLYHAKGVDISDQVLAAYRETFKDKPLDLAQSQSSRPPPQK